MPANPSETSSMRYMPLSTVTVKARSSIWDSIDWRQLESILSRSPSISVSISVLREYISDSERETLRISMPGRKILFPSPGMFSLHRKESRPAQLYASAMSPFHLGYALWTPEPHESGEVRIGDVGFVNQDGAFVRLLNVRPRYDEYKVTWWSQPATDMEPLNESAVYIDCKKGLGSYPRALCSRGVRSVPVMESVDRLVEFMTIKNGTE